jgi:hypothetical protein
LVLCPVDLMQRVIICSSLADGQICFCLQP